MLVIIAVSFCSCHYEPILYTPHHFAGSNNLKEGQFQIETHVSKPGIFMGISFAPDSALTVSFSSSFYNAIHKTFLSFERSHRSGNRLFFHTGLSVGRIRSFHYRQPDYQNSPISKFGFQTSQRTWSGIPYFKFGHDGEQWEKFVTVGIEMNLIGYAYLHYWELREDYSGYNKLTHEEHHVFKNLFSNNLVVAFSVKSKGPVVFQFTPIYSIELNKNAHRFKDWNHNQRIGVWAGIAVTWDGKSMSSAFNSVARVFQRSDSEQKGKNWI